MSLDLPTSTGVLGLLADPTRMRLLSLLESDELAVADLVAITELPQSRVSTHLGKLRDAAIVHDRRHGQQRLYSMTLHSLDAEICALWTTVKESVRDAVLESDRRRLREFRRAQGDGAARWFDAIAGQMEHHYSPGRTWESLTRGLTGLLQLGSVLDVGCGDGLTAQLLSSQTACYTGVDINQNLLAAARERLGDAKHIDFVHGDMHALPFDDARFDVALLFHVLTYAERPERALAEARRVLKPGGLLAIITLARHTHRQAISRYGHLKLGFDPKKLADMLKPLQVLSCGISSREQREPHFEVITAFATKAAI